jgi:ABC-type transport system involved in multi-copper enzyme maturation permease subunit
VWFVVVGVITALASGAVSFVTGAGFGAETIARGPVMFGFVVFFVLFLGLLVAPTLSASSINGDRNAGTLATLQVTLLSAAEIVLGKLLASWFAALAFLAASLPFIIWALAAGGVRVLSLLVTVLLLALILAVVCAVGLGFSALTARISGSAVLTYLTVAGLSVVTLIVFALSAALVRVEGPVSVYGADMVSSSDKNQSTLSAATCEWRTEQRTQVRTERIWWLLALNPFVIVADAAPGPTSTEAAAASFDPLSAIRLGVRYARTGPADQVDECWMRDGSYVSPVAERSLTSTPVWPWGLGAYLVIGAGSVALAVRRLRIPQKVLPRGTRVA